MKQHLPAGVTSRLAALVVLTLSIGLTTQWSMARADPPHKEKLAAAVVRMPSHGGSATVIFTEPNRTYLLSCGHCFEGSDRNKAIKLDIPAASPTARPIAAGIHLVKVDHVLDLSLIQLNAGPVDFVAPVAPDRHTPGPHLLSVGYDEMRLPAMQVPTHMLQSAHGTTWTREPPWHGRSGGALIDMDAGYVVGVVSGYEIGGMRRGIYASHDAICDFLHRCEGQGGQPAPGKHLQPSPEVGLAAPLPFAPLCHPNH
jgi:hypothetical protein